MKLRLDHHITRLGLVSSRSQAESYIRLGMVLVNGKVQAKPGFFVNEHDQVELAAKEQYVSRAGLKLASVSEALKLDFNNKVMLDVGSSTGGFTDYALRHGASKVIAVEVGTNQLHPSLQDDKRIELHEQTDIRSLQQLSSTPDFILIDVSFISLRHILPHIKKLCGAHTAVVAMVKPQFEAGAEAKNKGVIKNDKVRREVLSNFETWVKKDYFIAAKADSDIAGEKGNRERFYLLTKLS